MERSSLDRAALKDVPFPGLELIQPRCEQRLDRRWNDDLVIARLLQQRDHLLHEQRVALGSLLDPGLEAFVQLREALDQQRRLGGGERFEQHRRRIDLAAAPARPAVEEIRPRHAEQQDGGIARKIGHVLHQVEECRLAPVEVVEHADEGLRPRDRFELLAEGPGNLDARRDELLIAEQRADRLGCDGIEVDLGQLLDDLDHRPVRDALAVGKAASPDDERVVERGQELRCQA